MDITVTVASPNERDYFATAIPAMLAVASARGHSSAPYTLVHFARTWEPTTGRDVLQMGLETAGSASSARRHLEPLLMEHGLNDVAINDDPYSPLWNAGFAGEAFPALSRALYQAATRWMVGVASRWTARSLLDPPVDEALRLMVMHARATIDRSSQKGVDGFDMAQLLALRLLSYRSHYEAVYARAADKIGLDRFCDEAYLKHGNAARDAIKAANRVQLPSTPSQSDAQWYQLVEKIHDKTRKGFEHGQLVDVGRSRDDLERSLGRALEPTRFHTPPTEEVHRLLYQDADFLAYRLETSLLYSVLYTLGYSLNLRYVLCNLVSQANEETAGRSVEELRDDLERLASALAARDAHQTAVTNLQPNARSSS
ncbi:hypothetical protein I6H91_07730 [Micrococcus luteus]|uniref:hypothetical protein n=1 Tax=Micrococcus luteus TaxID=1270 RepID=UPI00191006B0|nr:hypothetical protein [Micrococcus luteus]QQE48063.1 hypothetical protein I6H91_07730 [Micrococcus luteus]